MKQIPLKPVNINEHHVLLTIMKIVRTKSPVSPTQIKQYLESELPPLFKEQRHADIDFTFMESANELQIRQPELYEDFLFKIEFVGDTELHITKSEHYTDDVNVLTLEDIINNLLLKFPGRDNIDLIAEGS
jgi:hypothetical protein